MADRIVVMNHGRDRAGRHAARDLRDAGDAVRRRLRRQDQRAAGRLRRRRRRCRVGASRCRAASTDTAAGAAVKLYLRPEDVHRAADRRRGDANALSTARSPRSSSSARICLVGVDARRRSGTADHGLPARSTTSPSTASRSAAALPRDAAARARCASSGARDGDARVGRRSPLPAARALRQRVHWQRPASRSGAAARGCAALVAVPARAAGHDPRQERAGQGRRVRRPRATSASYFATPALLPVDLEQRCGSRRWSRCITVPLAFALRLRADAQLHAAARALFRVHRADADPRAVAAVGDLVHPLVRQPGRCSKGLLGGAQHLRRRSASSSLDASRRFPHALMILLTALPLADARLYEAAESLRHADAGASSSRSRCRARSTA